jgi:hypothetical protein
VSSSLWLRLDREHDHLLATPSKKLEVLEVALIRARALLREDPIVPQTMSVGGWDAPEVFLPRWL